MNTKKIFIAFIILLLFTLTAFSPTFSIAAKKEVPTVKNADQVGTTSSGPQIITDSQGKRLANYDVDKSAIKTSSLPTTTKTNVVTNQGQPPKDLLALKKQKLEEQQAKEKANVANQEHNAGFALKEQLKH